MSLRERLGLGPDPIYLMDGSAFVFRGFYAFQNMSRSDGFPTNALYIVARILLRIIREERPGHFAFILDGKGPNFRHELFPDYKGQRSATPEPLVQQLEPLKRLMGVLGIPVLVSSGCEADDCIASLVERFRESHSVVIVGADKDLKQCLSEKVVLWDPAAKEEKITTLADFKEETGFEPSSWPDFQALVGDSSDNIPGVPKIGPKTAFGLVQQFPSLEKLFENPAAIPPKVRDKLEGQRENAFLYRQLTTLRTNCCLEVGLDDLAVTQPILHDVISFMAEFELRSLAREVESMSRVGMFAPAVQKNDGNCPAAQHTEKTSTQKELPVAKTAEKKQTNASAQPLAAAMAQGSLLSDAVKGEIELPVAADMDDIPWFKDEKSIPDGDAVLCILPHEKGVILSGAPETALQKNELDSPTVWERLYTGNLEEFGLAVASLNKKFKTADKTLSLLTADCKALWKKIPPLENASPGAWFDLSLAAYLLSPEDRGYAWHQVATRWIEQTGSGLDPDEHPGLSALALRALFKANLQGFGLTQIFENLEMPLIPVLREMEKRGITLDLKAFAEFLAEAQIKLEELTGLIYRQAGRTFNIRSSQQLADVLFAVLELPKGKKTQGGATSTSQEALEKLRGKHEIIETILEYRKLEKLRSTYLEPLPQMVDEQRRIHTSFNQMATATGRLSSSNPNLQNIPIRSEFGGRMRSCFISTPGKLLVCADYSQIELRVLAHLSGDPTLLDAFRKDEDIHARTAGLVFDVPLDQVTKEQRRNAKTINFGLIYGMGAQKLARELSITMNEAKDFIEKYFSRLAKLKEFYDSIEEDARVHGYVVTMAGRRRFTPDIQSGNNQLRSQARRQAINTRIQGSAADIIKIAMLAVENDPRLKDLEARLLLQIHDELVLEAPEANAEKAGKILVELMQSVAPGGEQLSVPLLAECGVGVNWAEAH